MADANPVLDSKTEKKKNKRDSIHFWNKWIPAAKRAASRHWNDSRRAWREYDSGNLNGVRGDGNREWSGTAGEGWAGERYPLY